MIKNFKAYAFFFLILPCVLFAKGKTSWENFTGNTTKFSVLFHPIAPSTLYGLVDAQSPEKLQELNTYFEIQKKYNELPIFPKNVIAYSLFWKSPHKELNQPIVNRETIYEENPDRLHGKSFFQRYLRPLIQSIKNAPIIYPGWVVRIYLANDLAFLIDDVFSHYPHVEVFLMESNSVAHSPGAFWRLLPFDDPAVSMVTIRDSDDILCEDIEKSARAWLYNPKTNGLYRFGMGIYEFALSREGKEELMYSPIMAGLFGAKLVDHSFQMEKAIKGFLLYRELYPNTERHPQDIAYGGHPYGFGNQFPTYGLDERFLKHVLYFYYAKKGQLTNLPEDNFLPPNHNLSLSNPVRADYYYIMYYRQYPKKG